MLSVYGALMPLRVLEEIRFWKTQEKEHTLVILGIAPNLESQYVQLMKQWEPVFAQVEFASQQGIEAVLRSPYVISPQMQSQVQALLNVSLAQSQLFVAQLQFMLANSAAVRANPFVQTVVQHIIRESEYFLGVLQAYGSGLPDVDWMPRTNSSFPDAGEDAEAGLAAALAGEARSGGHGGEGSDGPTDENNRIGWKSPDPALTAAAEGAWTQQAAQESRPVAIGGHTLPPLPYAYDALEPNIDAETMRLHHDVHHKSYVDGLNKAEKALQTARENGDFSLVKHWEREAAFNGAGHYLHTIFWNNMHPKGGGKPSGPIAQEISKTFGGFPAFKKQFSSAAEKVEGGGWALLVWSPRSHRVEILQAEKHQNLSQWDVVPLLVLDVWEHAYYLRYKTDRAKYIESWWNLVNWQHVNERFAAARTLKWQPF